MKENFDEHSDDSELIIRIEQMLGTNETVFYDLTDFEYIIDHYTANFEYKKALLACESAIAQYPFSTGLQIDKAQLLAMSGNFEDAMVLIDQVAEVEPQNPDVLLTRGIIFTQRGEYRDAVDHFKKALAFAEDRDDIYFNIGLT